MIDTAIRSPRRIFTGYLLAPKFFPLWDGGIAAEYWLLLGPLGSNAGRYCKLTQIVKSEVERLGGVDVIQRATGDSARKALDEYAYSKVSRNSL
jgi:hypothetical protein